MSVLQIAERRIFRSNFFLRVISESQVTISHTRKIFFSKIPHLKCWQRTTQPNNKPLRIARFKSSFKATIPFSIKKKLSNVKSSNKVQVHIKQSSVSATSWHKASPPPEMILSWGDFVFCHGFGEPHHSVLVLSTDCVGAQCLKEVINKREKIKTTQVEKL